nr:Adenylate kinase 7 [Polyrhizophydium stewartii]
MGRVFISNVDTALGHNLSRTLAATVVGSRRVEENEEEDDEAAAAAAAANSGAEGADKPKTDDKTAKDTYKITGSLHGRATTADIMRNPQAVLAAVSEPGQMIETGDKKKDAARREAIDKMAQLGQKPKWVKETMQSNDRNVLRQTLLSSDVIIYDIVASLEEASWAVDLLAEKADTFERPKTFIAVSSIMTWARTKTENEDGDGAVSEDEFRRRKPHPNWKSHIALEKNVIKLSKKSTIKAYVVAAGLIYHAGDSIFHTLLKSGGELMCFGDGNNNLPTIHLDDLISVVVELIETTPESKYIVAIDDSKNTLYDITKAISEALGSGVVKKVPKEEAFLEKSLTQANYDMLTVNLRLEPGHIKEMSIEWKYESGFVENMQQIAQEYKDARGLWPLKIVVHGTPASGKTFVAQKIAEHYKIHLIDPDQVVQDAVSRLERRANGELSADEQDDDVEVDRELLNEIREAVKANNGKYPSNHIISFVRERLRSMPCRNHGYVLDGFPTTLDEAKELFRAGDEETKDEKIPPADEAIVPEFVFSLEASDQFAKQRIMKLPEAEVSGTRNSEEGKHTCLVARHSDAVADSASAALTKRLEEFRKANTDENTVLNYFDELEIHPIQIPAENAEADEIMDKIIKAAGKPRNYGPSPEEIAEQRRKAEAERAMAEAQASEERAQREKEEVERHKKAVQEWNLRLEEVRKQEQEVLEAQSVPLRNYLMRHVMPTLTAGLIEVAKTRPEDPIDYLAEFLFKKASRVE